MFSSTEKLKITVDILDKLLHLCEKVNLNTVLLFSWLP